MRTLLIALLALAGAHGALAATFTVLPDGTGDYPTIQAALYAANDGDIIQLGNGTFTGPGNRDLDTNETELLIVSISGNPALCVIDCEGSAATPHYGLSYTALGAGAVLRGISIINGYANPAGGALLLSEAHITVENCIFADNKAWNFGGAVAALDWSAPTFRNCVFRDNSAEFYGKGGAIYYDGSGSPLITGCTFNGNAADQGGAVYFTAGLPTVVSSTFFYNLPGAIYVDTGCALTASKTILAYNRGPGAAVAGAGVAQLNCCDLYGNHGGDWVGSIAGQFGTNGNISGDPQLIDPWLGNFNIATTSPCATSVNPACGRIGVGLVAALAPTYVLHADGLGMLPTIQAAVDVAPAGAVISLEDGIYRGTGNRNITLRGRLVRIEGRSGDATAVVLDVEGSHATPRRAFQLFSGEPEGTTLQHLTMRGGYGNEDTGVPAGGKGGAIRLSSGSSLKVLNCRFEDNTVYHHNLVYADVGRAGAIDNDGGGDLWLQDCTFERNSADQAILHTGRNLTLLSCTFADNPGCVEVQSPTGVVNMAGCLFSDFGEQAVYCVGVVGTLRIFSCDFTAPGFRVDGAIRLRDCGAATIDQCQVSQLDGMSSSLFPIPQPLVAIIQSSVGILNSVFAGNTGGSTLLITDSVCQITNCQVTDNAPDFEATLRTVASTLIIDQCQFTGNQRDGVDADRCNLTVTACTFDGNRSGIRHLGSSLGGVRITGTTFANHSPGFAVQVDSMLTRPVVIDRCGFSANRQGLRLFQVPNFRLANTSFSDNPDSGAVQFSYASGAIDTCTFARNVSGETGGALNLDNADVGVKDCLFIDNAAGSQGGAVYLQDSYSSFTRCRFEGNSSARAGGGLASATSTAILNFCEFTANQGSLAAGAANFWQSAASLNFCDLTDNTSPIYAGGAQFGECASVVVNHCTVTGNSAEIVGGIFVSDSPSVQIEATVVANNTSGHSGSGVALYNVASATIGNCTVVGNGGNGNSGGTTPSGQVFINLGSSALLTNNIIAFGTAGPAVAQGWPLSTITVLNCNVFDNAGGDWVGPLAGLDGTACNFSLNPLFCDSDAGDYQLAEMSPCLAVNNGCTIDLGALGQGCLIATPVPDEAELPSSFVVLGNSPNPFNPRTEISFELPAPGAVEVDIYDVAGRRVRRLAGGEQLAAGRHRVLWNGTDDAGRAVTSGLYLYRVAAAGRVLTGKMALLR